MGRAAVVNVAQLVSYSQFKQIILENSEYGCYLPSFLTYFTWFFNIKKILCEMASVFI